MPQQGTNFHLLVQLVGVELDDLSEIEILFKQYNLDNATALKTSIWKADGSGEAKTSDVSENTISIPWTRAETYLFKRGAIFYLHARIHYAHSSDEPEVPITELIMSPSLFAEGEEVT